MNKISTYNTKITKLLCLITVVLFIVCVSAIFVTRSNAAETRGIDPAFTIPTLETSLSVDPATSLIYNVASYDELFNLTTGASGDVNWSNFNYVGTQDVIINFTGDIDGSLAANVFVPTMNGHNLIIHGNGHTVNVGTLRIATSPKIGFDNITISNCSNFTTNGPNKFDNIANAETTITFNNCTVLNTQAPLKADIINMTNCTIDKSHIIPICEKFNQDHCVSVDFYNGNPIYDMGRPATYNIQNSILKTTTTETGVGFNAQGITSSTFNNCEIYGFNTGLNIGTIDISNSDIHNNRLGIQTYSSSSIINMCKVYTNSGYGIQVYGGADINDLDVYDNSTGLSIYTNSAVTIDGCNIHNNNLGLTGVTANPDLFASDVIVEDPIGYTTLITNTTFSENSRGTNLIGGKYTNCDFTLNTSYGATGTNTSFINCNVYDNTESGFFDLTNSYVYNSDIYNNQYGFNRGNAMTTIRSSRIHDNTDCNIADLHITHILDCEIYNSKISIESITGNAYVSNTHIYNTDSYLLDNPTAIGCKFDNFSAIFDNTTTNTAASFGQAQSTSSIMVDNITTKDMLIENCGTGLQLSGTGPSTPISNVDIQDCITGISMINGAQARTYDTINIDNTTNGIICEGFLVPTSGIISITNTAETAIVLNGSNGLSSSGSLDDSAIVIDNAKNGVTVNNARFEAVCARITNCDEYGIRANNDSYLYYVTLQESDCGIAGLFIEDSQTTCWLTNAEQTNDAYINGSKSIQAEYVQFSKLKLENADAPNIISNSTNSNSFKLDITDLTISDQPIVLNNLNSLAFDWNWNVIHSGDESANATNPNYGEPNVKIDGIINFDTTNDNYIDDEDVVSMNLTATFAAWTEHNGSESISHEEKILGSDDANSTFTTAEKNEFIDYVSSHTDVISDGWLISESQSKPHIYDGDAGTDIATFSLVQGEKVTYDYNVNHGTTSVVAVGRTNNVKNYTFGSLVDLSYTATKPGYTFIGWSKDPNAKTPTQPWNATKANTTVYAIFKKDINVAFHKYDTSIINKTGSLYNNDLSINVTVPENSDNTDNRQFLGYVESGVIPDKDTIYSNSISVNSSENYYECYKDISTLKYDILGTIDNTLTDTKVIYQTFEDPLDQNYVYTIKQAPSKSGYTFKNWVNSDNLQTYVPNSIFNTTSNSNTLIADYDQILVNSITVSPESIIMNVGDTFTPTVTVLPTDALNKSFGWSSIKSNTASVTDSGLITAVTPGETDVYATTKDGSNLTDYIHVIVNQREVVVKGTLTYSNGNPIANKDIELKSVDTDVKTKTNNNGDYQFDNVKTGSYNLTIYNNIATNDVLATGSIVVDTVSPENDVITATTTDTNVTVTTGQPQNNIIVIDAVITEPITPSTSVTIDQPTTETTKTITPSTEDSKSTFASIIETGDSTPVLIVTICLIVVVSLLILVAILGPKKINKSDSETETNNIVEEDEIDK